jgi:hypothetical protein
LLDQRLRIGQIIDRSRLSSWRGRLGGPSSAANQQAQEEGAPREGFHTPTCSKSRRGGKPEFNEPKSSPKEAATTNQHQ